MFKSNSMLTTKKYSGKGPILITHKGFSGPVILRLSAFSARNLYDNKYKAELRINWLCMNENEARLKIDLYKLENGKKLIFNYKPFHKLPRSLWKSFLLSLNIDSQLKWAELSKSKKRVFNQIFNNENLSYKGSWSFW